MSTLVGESRQNSARSFTDAKGMVTYEEDKHYILYADNITQSKDQLALTPGLPRVNETVLGSMLCKSVNFERDPDKPTRWTVSCTFSSKVEEGTDPQTPQQGDPTLWVPYGEVTFEPFDEVVTRDLDGKAWVNTAGVPFEQGLIIQRRVASVPFTQYEPLSSTDLDEIMSRSDCVNSEPFMDKPRYSLLLQVDNAKIGTFYGHRCWQVSYTIKYKPWPQNSSIKGHWHLQQLSAGYHYLKAPTGPQVPDQHFYEGDLEPFEKNGVPYVGLLGQFGTPSVNKVPYWISFRVNEEIDFSKFLRIRNF